MTRIDAHRDVVSAQQDSQAQDHAQLRYATLHHGVCFAYGSNSPHGRLMRTLRLRRLQQLARLRAILLRRLSRGKAGASEGEEGEGAAPYERAERLLLRRNETRDQQRGGGGNSNSDSDSDESERGRPKPPRIKALQPIDRSRVARRRDDGRGGNGGSGTDSGSHGDGGSGMGGGGGREQDRSGGGPDKGMTPSFAPMPGAPAAPIRGALGKLVAHVEKTGDDTVHPDALGAAWIDDLHALLNRLASDSNTDFYASVLELNLSWLRVQERFGQATSGGIARFIERIPAANASSPGTDRAAVASRSDEISAPSAPAPAPEQAWSERLRSARFLAPLLSLNGMHPRPRAWFSTARAKLEGMQAHTLDRRSRSAARDDAQHPDTRAIPNSGDRENSAPADVQP